MAIQYYMRAYNTTLSQYVDWVVNDAPDSIGTFSGYPTNQLINITVNRIVQSKVDNFLKPNQSLGGTDGLFFHVNSYDWRNAVTPIGPPTGLTGFQVKRGATAVSSITSATNASPINITTSVPHGLVTGQIVTINGVIGNVAANGTWPITVIGGIGSTNFTLNGSVGTGASVPSGNVFTPRDMSSLIWDEINDTWRLVFNTNGDGTSLGASQSLVVNNLLVDGFLSLGADPADTGIIRLPNDQYIFSESNPSGTDVQLIGADLFNRIKLGSIGTDIVYTPGVLVVDGYIQHDSTSGNIAASTGFIREQNNTNIIAYKNINQAFTDIVALSSTDINKIVIGDTVNTGTIHNTASGTFNITAATATNPVQITVSAPTTFVDGQSVTINGITGTIGTDATNGLNGKTFTIDVISTTEFLLNGSNGTGLAYTSGGTAVTNNVHQFQVGGTTQVELGAPFVRFPSGITAPFILQSTALPSTSGQNLTIQSQNAGLGGLNGGNLTLTTGTGITNGLINLQTGGVTRVTLSDTTETHIHQIITFANTVTNPIITQNSILSGDGTTLTVQAQATVSGEGGDLNLSSGAGSSQSGEVFVQTGGVTQIVVSPLTIPPSSPLFGPPTTGTVIIKGNLEVQGAMTTVESTVVDIIGRVIHANWADPITSPNVAPPTQISGYSIHRGNFGSGIPRDGAAWIWTENPDGYTHAGADGYWRAVTIPGDGIGTDNFSISNSLNIVGVMGNDFSASSDPNPISGYLASSGSLRTANNVPVAVSRNITANTTLDLSATNGTATLPLTDIPVVSTTGFTTSGTLLIVSSAGVQTVTYTGLAAGPTRFTGAVGGTGTIVTGGIVGQTNRSTTFNGTNGTNFASLPSNELIVVSTTGFPASGTLRVVSHTSNSITSPPSVQVITYTGIAADRFTGCSVGTGFLFVGDAVTSLPATGTQDLVLLGTDFGNRILHGSPSNNTGHIFNTPTGFFYDFQINSVSHVQLRGDTDTDSFIKTITIAPTINTPKIYQSTLPNTGANNGFNLKLQAQAGQQQTGGNANNNGGNLVLASGAAGTGGAGAAGIHGTVDILTDAQLKVRIFPTDASPVGSSDGDNSILYFESLFRVDSAESGAGPLAGTGIRFRQDDTVAATGQVYTIQAQNAATTGGNLVLTSGFGSSANNAGQVRLSTGSGTSTSIDRVIVYPTGAPVLPQGPSGVGISYTEFRDTAQAVFINPVSTGIASIGFAETVTGAQIAQVGTAATPSAPMTIQSQVTTAGSGVGGNLSLIAGNATGATSTGGNLNLASGSGTTINGVINFQPGGVTQVLITATGQFIQWVSTMTNPTLNQVTTGGATGTTLTVQAQNAATTGGNLTLTSGTGGTVAGDINLQTGAVSRVIIHPTFTEFRDTAEALRVTPVSAGTTQITYASTVTAAQFNQTLTAATPSAPMTIQSQETTAASGQGGNLILIAGNATGTTSTGGNAILTSGTGTTVAGNTQLQTGGVDRVVVHPTFTEFRDAAEALRITPVSAGTTQITFATTVTAASINQTATGGATGANLTVQAQNAATTGGNVIITSGTATTAGNVQLQTGAVDKVVVHPTFTEFRDTAEAYRITPVSAGATTLRAISTATSVTYFQEDTADAVGADTTIQAQNADDNGGNLLLTSGTGALDNGAVELQAGGVTTASVITDKFVFNKGQRRNVTSVTTTYQVLASDDYIAVTTLAAPFTITLPVTPTLGDTYTVKDAVGNAATNNVTIDGNGTNIDGTATITLSQNYAAVVLTYTGTQWSVS